MLLLLLRMLVSAGPPIMVHSPNLKVYPFADGEPLYGLKLGPYCWTLASMHPTKQLYVAEFQPFAGTKSDHSHHLLSCATELNTSQLFEQDMTSADSTAI